MKELSIEQKAKAYDEAKLRMSVAYNSNRCTLGFMNEIFPELKENRDEKTKRILHSISSKISFHLCDIFTEEEFQCFDAWSNALFEKQCEQKTTAWTPMDEQRVENLLAIIEGHGYPGEVAWLNSLKDRVQSKQDKQKSPAWNKEDEMMIKFVLTHFRMAGATENSDIIKWLKSLKERVQPK
jgi:hypothetical protein